MAIGIKVCKVCGKEYEACHTLRPNMNNEFRWQDVACCPEHGAEYLRKILQSRSPAPEAPKQEEVQEEIREETPAPKKRIGKRKSEVDASEKGKEMA